MEEQEVKQNRSIFAEANVFAVGMAGEIVALVKEKVSTFPIDRKDVVETQMCMTIGLELLNNVFAIVATAIKEDRKAIENIFAGAINQTVFKENNIDLKCVPISDIILAKGPIQ